MNRLVTTCLQTCNNLCVFKRVRPASTLISELKINDATRSTTHYQHLWIRKSFLEFDYCNNCLKVVSVTYKQICSLKTRCICYNIDFNSTAHVETCSRVAQLRDVIVLRTLEEQLKTLLIYCLQ